MKRRRFIAETPSPMDFGEILIFAVSAVNAFLDAFEALSGKTATLI